jgi:RNA polymerase sigma factor (sigma-70 family)
MDQVTMAAISAHREQKILAAVRDYGKRLAGFVRRRVSSDEEAEDILQDVWLQLANVADLDPIEKLGSWLYRVARNRITDQYRKKKPLPVSRLIGSLTTEDDTVEDLLFIEPETPEDDVLRRIFWEELFRALDELPEAQKQVFIWNEIEGSTFEELSRQTGENIKTLISRKRYAVKKLRARLTGLRDELSNEQDNPEE